MEWPETPIWKPATAVACVAVVCVTVLAWQARKAKVTEQKFAEAATACRARAERGDAKAESDLAYMYSHGLGVPQDYGEALRWRRKAADQNYPDGEDGLGYMYFYGQGVPQDYAEALRWYRKAADQSDAKGQNSLGLIYEQGQGVSQDYAEALYWYRKAADQGYAAAQYNLGNMYYYGRGVPQDRAEAFRWFRKAADQGDDYAQRVLHIKWKGLRTSAKISLSITFLASLLVLAGHLRPRGSFQEEKQRTFTLAGLLGLSFVALDLLGFRYISILTPLVAVFAFQFIKSLVAGASTAILLQAVFPQKLWSKAVRTVLGIFGILFVGVNLLLIANTRLRSAVPGLRSFWSINAMLLGMITSVALVFWLIPKKAWSAEIAEGEVAVSDSPTDSTEDVR